MIYFYYRKSIDTMVLVNSDPDPDWEKNARDATCEIFLKHKKIEFEWANLSLVAHGKEQKLVAYALRVNAIGEPGDEYDDE